MGDLLQMGSSRFLYRKQRQPGGLSEGSLFTGYVSECSKSLKSSKDYGVARERILGTPKGIARRMRE